MDLKVHIIFLAFLLNGSEMIFCCVTFITIAGQYLGLAFMSCVQYTAVKRLPVTRADFPSKIVYRKKK